MSARRRTHILRTGPPSNLSTATVMSIAAVAMSLIAIFGELGSSMVESPTATTVVFALLSLVPWAFIAGGVDIPATVFAVVGLTPAIVIVLVDNNPGGMFPALFVVIWVVRGTGQWRVIVPTVLAPIVAIVLLTLMQSSAHDSGMIYFIGGIGIAALSGMMLRRQDELTNELQAMGELRLAHAAAAERARIAREVHDVVAHSLTVTMLHLGGARRALRHDPAVAEAALAQAEVVGRDSLDSIRQIMGLLRSEEEGHEATPPMPGIAALIDLVERYRSAGLDVAIDVQSAELTVEPATALVIYRVVQESLSNVVNHADSAPTSITITDGGAPGSPTIELQITNAPRRGAATPLSPSDERTGLGLRGMTERVQAAGGTLAAGTTSDGGWEVSVSVPRHTSGIAAATPVGVAAESADPVSAPQ